MQIVTQPYQRRSKVEPFEDGYDPIVVEVTWNFLLEIPEQIMRIPAVESFPGCGTQRRNRVPRDTSGRRSCARYP